MGAPQPLGERDAQDLQPARPDAGHAREAAVPGGGLERLERIDVQRLMEIARQRGADAGKGAKQRLGVERAAQPVEQAQPPRAHQLEDRAGERAIDPGQRDERAGTAALDPLAHIVAERRDEVGSAAIGADAEGARSLRRQERGDLAQAFADLTVHARVDSKPCAGRRS